jgi:hypothetical protein
MALHYQTEYRLGDRGRICRSYTGLQAFAAIGLDLVFGALFELVSSAIGLGIRIVALAIRLVVGMLRINWRILVALMTYVVYAVTLPFAWIHLTADGLRSRGKIDRTEPRASPAPVVKPSWALSREV